MEHKDSAKILTGRMKKIAKQLSKYYTVKIGLLAGKGGDMPVSENADLAYIGAVQEYGAKIKVTDKMRGYFRHNFGVNLKKDKEQIEIPARSWLYEPIKDEGFRKLVYEFVGDQEVFEEYADKDFMKQLAKLIGEAGMLQIQRAFANGGINGEWPANSPITVASKGSSKPLIDNSDLRGHITYEVE